MSRVKLTAQPYRCGYSERRLHAFRTFTVDWFALGGECRYAAVRSSLSGPRMTIFSASSGNGCLGFIPWRAHPNIPFFIGCQDHRHCLGMDRLDHRVQRRRQEAVHEVRSGDRFRLGAPVAFELGPDTGKCGERPIVIQREPNDVLLLRLGVRFGRILGKAISKPKRP
jgi:hypothetical protein